LNGNGQAWYTQNKGNSNEPRRPITITFYNSTNLYIDGLSFVQPQFWASFISYSENVTFINNYVNATSTDPNGPTVNTDGTDTWNSNNIYVANWIVQNGDDCVAAKGNTTNLTVRNVTCYG
jgi:galacturan 1,4-alpha-galacturonidase